MLEVQNLTKRYNKTLAVDNVSFTVNTGRIGILLGPNGAGKSTVIKSIAGLLKYEGGVGIDGLPARTTEAKKIFGYVPELPALFPNLTVAEHLEYIRRAYDVSVSDEEVEKLLERFEMEDKKEKHSPPLQRTPGCPDDSPGSVLQTSDTSPPHRRRSALHTPRKPVV